MASSHYLQFSFHWVLTMIEASRCLCRVFNIFGIANQVLELSETSVVAVEKEVVLLQEDHVLPEVLRHEAI